MALSHSASINPDDERFRVTLSSIGDAVIVTDSSAVISFLNPVAEELTGWPAEEAIGEPIEKVFRIVNEITRAPVANPATKVLRLGRVVGLANHTILIARDGTERPIDDSGAPVRDARGKIEGVVIVFRDVTERRQAELHANRLAAIVEHSNDAIVGKDLSGIVTSWNRSAERIFGYSAKEMIGQPITRLFPTDRLHEEAQILARLQRGETVEPFETIRVRKDGSPIHIRVSISPIKDADGRVVGASKTAHPIHFNEQQFKITLSSIGDGVIVTDAKGAISFMNPVAEELTGWRSDSAIGHPLDEVFRIFNELTRAPVANPAAKVLRSGRVVGLANHTILIARDGTERPIDDSGAPVRDARGKIEGVVLVFRDVSERRRAELHANQLAAIVEHSIDGIIGKDLNGRVTSWNRAAEQIFGYSAAEMIGQPITRLFPPDRLNEEQKILERIQRGESVEAFETTRLRKDGTHRHMRVSLSPIKDADGRVVGASKIARDITRQWQEHLDLIALQKKLQEQTQTLEARVQERTAELEEKIGELEAFSYSLSHDMRAPIRAIRSFTEIVLEDRGHALDATTTSHLQRVISAAARMDRLIEDVLSFSRLSQRVITLEPTDAEKLIDEIINERPELLPPRANITIERPLPAVQGHPALLTQCIGNFLDNAVKFVAPGTVPHIRIRAEPAGNGCIRLWFEDNGIGISREGRRRLFGLFQRLHATGSYEGVGIGLAIVRKAVERMHGEVGVESEPGQGSRFWIILPEALSRT